jgi:type II secretory pathway pseudopilin PulG
MSRRLNLLAEHGYSMLVVVMVMLATGMLAAAAFAAVGGDIPFARASQDRKQAYAAAEAGIEYYLYQLARDNDYWTNCADVDPTAPINLEDPAPAARKWRDLAGADARFSIELLPGEGECDTDNPEETMLDEETGTFRIRSTGETNGEKRTIVSTYRRSSFLDYLYFTDYEALDPLVFDPDVNVNGTSDDEVEYARKHCVQYRAVREQNNWCTSNVSITFPDWDAINGPLHTNDDLLICGSPDFGRADKPDRIEISGPEPNGWTDRTGCAGNPNFVGTVRHPAPTLTVPASNSRLKDAALPGYLFTGQTTIVFNGTNTMTVTTHEGSSTPTTFTRALPSNGVIYVQKDTGGACTIDSPRELNYDNEWRCAILTVRGQYPKSMTLGSQDDILINGNLTKSNDSSVLGLIANRFVRVWHDVSGDCGSNLPSDPPPLHNMTIEAAILALNDSFIVDNWRCGAVLGTLTVKGAIAQRFRGPVGTFSGSTKTHGYTKNYNYDDRLRYRSPPYFLDPISAAWRVVRSNEQAPGTD